MSIRRYALFGCCLGLAGCERAAAWTIGGAEPRPNAGQGQSPAPSIRPESEHDAVAIGAQLGAADCATCALPSAVAANPASPARTHAAPRILHYTARRALADVPRVYAKTRNVWIRPKPTTREPWIGFLWFGGSVRLKDTTPIPGWGCNTAFYAIEPRGYVCVDGKRATLDPNDPLVQALAPHSPDTTLPDPHPHYGESLDAVRYAELPDQETMLQREPEFARALHAGILPPSAADTALDSSLAALSPSHETPWLVPGMPENLRDRHPHLIKGSAVAWTREVTHAGRTLLLTDDLSWVPKDRVRPLRQVQFEGVHLDAGLTLPLAFFRDEQPEYERKADGSFAPTQTLHARLSWVRLNGTREVEGAREFVQMGNGRWLAADEVVIPAPRELTPWGARVSEPDTTGNAPPGRATWVQVSVRGGWLLAYEGTKPVFATLISAGRGGPPHGSKPPGSTASTPTGWFNITGKFTTATMIAPDRLVHSAVPWAQNFTGPYSLHSAYWHDGWGYGKSGGCVNLSPKDSYFLFHFTEPALPEGWHGVRWQPELEPATGVVIERGPWRPPEVVPSHLHTLELTGPAAPSPAALATESAPLTNLEENPNP